MTLRSVELPSACRPSMALALILLAILAASSAHATHFRYGHISWDQAGGNAVDVKIQAAWRLTSASGRCIDPATDAIVACSGTGGAPGIGDVFFESTGNTRFDWGDGSPLVGSPRGPLYFLVTSIDPAKNWLFGEAVDPNSLPQVRTTLSHTYEAPGDYEASLASCCRISRLSFPNAHINNPDGSYRVATRINAASSQGSPRSSLPPIIACPLDGICAFQVPAIASGLATFRLATATEAGSGFRQPGPPHALHPASIDSDTGLYLWDTTGAQVGPAGYDTLYSTQVIIEDGASRVALDFLIHVEEVVPPLPNFDGTSVCGTQRHVGVGSVETFAIIASDPDENDTVELNVAGLPAGASMSPPLPTHGNPVESTFSWTPTAASIGSHVITFTARSEPGGGMALCDVILTVGGMTSLRAMTWNILGVHADSDHFNEQEGIARRILEYGPHVVGLQEAQFGDADSIGLLLNDGLGATPLYSGVWAQKPGDLKALPLVFGLTHCFGIFDGCANPEGVAILSRYPILDSGAERVGSRGKKRVVVWVAIDVPQVGRVYVYNTHLDRDREQRRDLLGLIDEHVRRESASFEAILLGDMNERPGEPGYEELVAGGQEVAFLDSFGKVEPESVDNDVCPQRLDREPSARQVDVCGYTSWTHKSRRHNESPRQRLDYVFVQDGGAGSVLDSVTPKVSDPGFGCASEQPKGGCADDPLNYRRLSDHLPVVTTIGYPARPSVPQEEGIDYPLFLEFPGQCSGAPRGECRWFDVGVRSDELGVVRINEFIEERRVATSVPLFRGHGDDRSFDAWASALDSRFSIELNFHTGIGRFYVQQSCVEKGPSSGPVHDNCEAPRPIRFVENHSDLYDKSHNNLFVSAPRAIGGDVEITVAVQATNSLAVFRHDCSIDTVYDLHFDGSTGRWSAHIRSNESDPYPSKEVFAFLQQHDPGEGVPLLLAEESDRGVSALCDIEN
jgi:endonuclease/exonuclease/phosphatase family metal-dependent hydrolase